MANIFNEQFLIDNRSTFEEFAKWYNANDKANSTQVTLSAFFDIKFELQLGYYMEWMAGLGVFITSRVEPINKHLMLKVTYTDKPDLRFHYHDLDEIDTSHFVKNPLEAYELLVATFIYQCQYPF